MKIAEKILNLLEKSGLETTIENIAKKAGKPFKEVKKKFQDIEKALQDNKDVADAAVIPIAISTLKKAFNVE